MQYTWYALGGVVVVRPSAPASYKQNDMFAHDYVTQEAAAASLPTIVGRRQLYTDYARYQW